MGKFKPAAGNIMKKNLSLLTLLVFAFNLSARDIRYVEKFSIAENREEALRS